MTCEHDWRAGPFYIMVAGTYEEPDYYSPSSFINAEHCTKCGLLWIQDGIRSQTDSYLQK